MADFTKYYILQKIYNRKNYINIILQKISHLVRKVLNCFKVNCLKGNFIKNSILLGLFCFVDVLFTKVCLLFFLNNIKNQKLFK